MTGSKIKLTGLCKWQKGTALGKKKYKTSLFVERRLGAPEDQDSLGRMRVTGGGGMNEDRLWTWERVPA